MRGVASSGEARAERSELVNKGFGRHATTDETATGRVVDAKWLRRREVLPSEDTQGV